MNYHQPSTHIMRACCASIVTNQIYYHRLQGQVHGQVAFPLVVVQRAPRQRGPLQQLDCCQLKYSYRLYYHLHLAASQNIMCVMDGYLFIYL